jgi:hypothetical protein
VSLGVGLNVHGPVANSRAIVVAGYGHTVAQYGCMGALVSRFVISSRAGGLDTSCVAAIEPPPFLLH